MPEPRAVTTRRRVLGAVLIWGAFLAVHVVLSLINLYDVVHFPFGDVTQVYRFWMEYAEDNGVLVGIDTSWVYPIGALLPMGAAYLLGPELYGHVWLVLVTALDAVALAVLVRHSRAAAWWWIVYLAALGPISLARIDAVTVPLALLAAVWILRRPVVASVLLALATWIKIWPVALLAAAVVTLRERIQIVIGAAALTAVLLLGAVAMGGGAGIVSFIFEQTDRGLQVEAPVSMWWLWAATAGLPGGRVYYDTDILTYQVSGPGATATAAAMTPLLALTVAAIVVLGVVALRRGVDRVEVLVELSMALVVALIVVNKVGSPQFECWLAAPVVLGILHGRSAWRGRALAVLAIAVLTQIVYPWAYSGIVEAEYFAVGVLTVRNFALVALLAVSVVALARLVRRSAVSSRVDRAAMAELA